MQITVNLNDDLIKMLDKLRAEQIELYKRNDMGDIHIKAQENLTYEELIIYCIVKGDC